MLSPVSSLSFWERVGGKSLAGISIGTQHFFGRKSALAYAYSESFWTSSCNLTARSCSCFQVPQGFSLGSHRPKRTRALALRYALQHHAMNLNHSNTTPPPHRRHTERSEGPQYFAFAVACSFLALAACNVRKPYAPPHPSDVDRNAMYIQGLDGKGVWSACTYDGTHDQCKIWSVGGTVLSGGIFVPYDGGAAALPSELKIAQQGGSDVIKLQNGRYFIPANGNGHAAAVRYLDFMTNKTQSFEGKKEGQN